MLASSMSAKPSVWPGIACGKMLVGKPAVRPAVNIDVASWRMKLEDPNSRRTAQCYSVPAPVQDSTLTLVLRLDCTTIKTGSRQLILEPSSRHEQTSKAQ